MFLAGDHFGQVTSLLICTGQLHEENPLQCLHLAIVLSHLPLIEMILRL